MFRHWYRSTRLQEVSTVYVKCQLRVYKDGCHGATGLLKCVPPPAALRCGAGHQLRAAVRRMRILWLAVVCSTGCTVSCCAAPFLAAY